jgi:hypothetical protein
VIISGRFFFKKREILEIAINKEEKFLICEKNPLF